MSLQGTAKATKSGRGLWAQMLLLALITLAGAGCGGSGVDPVEEEQIKAVVEGYYVRGLSVPEYEAEVEEVRDGWARVTMRPSGVDNEGGDETFFLQNQGGAGAAEPTRQLSTQPGDTVDVSTPTGWVIVAGPQAQFAPEELEALGVPLEVRD
jgi:hypothetical protein